MQKILVEFYIKKRNKIGVDVFTNVEERKLSLKDKEVKKWKGGEKC